MTAPVLMSNLASEEFWGRHTFDDFNAAATALRGWERTYNYERFSLALQEVLAGSENAHRVLGILIGQGVLRPDPGPCFLDLDQVDVITSSFLRDCLLEYRNHARTTVPHLYPVIANPAPKVLYEMTG